MKNVTNRYETRSQLRKWELRVSLEESMPEILLAEGQATTIKKEDSDFDQVLIKKKIESVL